MEFVLDAMDDNESFSLIDSGILITTRSLLLASCNLVINMINISKDVVETLRTQGLSPALFRFVNYISI